MNEQLQWAQDLIETTNSSVDCGFNMFIMGDDLSYSDRYHDFSPRSIGYDHAKKMSEENGIAFTYNFGCRCGGSSFKYGGFFVCNKCERRGVDKEWWKIQVEKDGNSFCCHGLDFEDLQESENYAFGDTYQESINNYKAEMMKHINTKGSE